MLLEPILSMLVRHISDPRFGEMACDVAAIVIGISLSLAFGIHQTYSPTEMYAGILGQSPMIDSLFVRLRKKVHQELRFQQEVVGVKGALDMLLASASLGS